MTSNRYVIGFLDDQLEAVADEIVSLNKQCDELERENWALKQALGYPIPADKDTPNNPWRCSICDARNKETKPDGNWLLERLRDHYWNSLEPQKELIMAHVCGAIGYGVIEK